MATIKSHSDLDQSRKLAEILPLESADMKWFSWEKELNSPLVPTFGYDKETAEFYKDTKAIYLPCWSLAALLRVLPHIQEFYPTIAKINDKYVCRYAGSGIWTNGDNSIDACVAMIEKLHELNLL